ncbi:methyltransferase domain-containing protein [Pleurocapsales cyanobacterium LEGE 06147]|nr:methyltransferase domain-containing protein [Pleurocapsales cyanobacterium LEGE 06147]
MIESNNPEINVDELMEKIREEVAKRKTDYRPSQTKSSLSISSLSNHLNQIEALLKNAESRSLTRTKLPAKYYKLPLAEKLEKFILKTFNLLFRDQREVNYNLTSAFKQSISINRQLITEIEVLRSQLDKRLGNVASRTQSVDERLGNVASRTQSVDERLRALENHTQVIDEQLESLATNMDERLRALEHRTHAVDERLANSVEQRFGALEHRTHAVDERLANSVEQRLGALEHRTHAVDERLANSVEQRLGALEHRTHAVDESLGSINSHIQKLSENYLTNNSYLINDLIQQKRLIALFLEEARKRLPEPFDREQLQTFINEDKHALDAFYAAFEDEFRGSREDILNRLKVYLPLIEQAEIGKPESPILDVGCGRGEWLELLKESGYTAKGIDNNRVMLERCSTKKLDVLEADVIAYLQSLADASLGAVTGFHIIEHLQFPVLIKLIEEVFRVLQPGGMAIFETPNPKNLVVGACNFYSDLTHNNPIFPETIQFCLKYQGLLDVQLLYLNPVENSPFARDDLVKQTLNNWFFGPRDYAVVGYKK